MVGTLFLDYGGLIVDYKFNKKTLFRAHSLVKDYLNNLGHSITIRKLNSAHESAIQSYLGARESNGCEWPMKKIIGLVLDKLCEYDDAMLERVSELYKLHDHDVELKHGATALPELAKRHKLGIISNLPHDSLIYELRRFDLLDLFKTITMSHQAGFRKPHRKIYEFALKKAKARPSESLFASHEQAELDGAATVGMRTMLTDNLEKLLEIE